MIALSSCDKSYKYVEKVSDEGILGGISTKEKEEKIIKAKSDSIAYLEAFKMFCISLKTDKDMLESFGKSSSITIGFKLINDKGEDITNTTIFVSKQKRMYEIEKQVFSLENSFEEAIKNNEKDKIEELKK